MEIQLSPQKSRKHWYITGAIGVLISSILYFSQSEAVPSVVAEDVTFLKVERGTVDVFSQAFGELFSAHERMLTSQASGKVSAIHLRPGALVEPDTVILSLANPELIQSYQSALGDLNANKAQFESFELEQENERLDFQGRMADIESTLESAQLDLRVNKELSERGVSATLEILRAELAVNQQARKLEFEQQKYQHFLKVQAFRLKQREIELQQFEQEVHLLAQQLEDMEVKAGIQGTLQSLDVEIGESLPEGATLGRVGSVDQLLARLRVPQHQADQIAIGAAVELNTRKGQILGEVNRIESLVSNGVVLAEVTLLGELPTDARPLAPITGQIFMHTQQDALYVEQAAGLRPMSQLERFVLADDDSSQATKTRIQLGDLSKGKLIIESGIRAEQQFIAQMNDAWATHQTINIEEQG